MTLCDEAIANKFKGVCVNPCYIKPAVARLGNSGRIAMAVVGFPLGANLTAIKVEEAKRAVGEGAGELDMVINVGLYLSGEKAAVRSDIEQVIKAAGSVPVKVILETCFLTPDQITELSKWCVEAKAAFVKTSTGFAARGASIEDIAAMRLATDGTKTTIKASGGIRSLDAAIMMAKAGASVITRRRSQSVSRPVSRTCRGAGRLGARPVSCTCPSVMMTAPAMRARGSAAMDCAKAVRASPMARAYQRTNFTRIGSRLMTGT